MNGNLIIKNASELVTCSGFAAKRGREMDDLHIIPDGALVIKQGIIEDIGTTGDIEAKLKKSGADLSGFEVIDAQNKAVLPGFVDSHTHFIFGGYRADEFSWRLRGDSYMQIMQRGGGIVNTVKATQQAGHNELLQAGIKRLDSMLSFGVTTVECKSGYGLDKDTEIKQLEVINHLDGIHYIDIVPTFLGAHAVPENYKGREDAFVDFMMEEVMPQAAERKLAQYGGICAGRRNWDGKSSFMPMRSYSSAGRSWPPSLVQPRPIICCRPLMKESGRWQTPAWWPPCCPELLSA